MFRNVMSMNTRYYCLMAIKVSSKLTQFKQIKYVVISLVNKTIDKKINVLDKIERKLSFPGKTLTFVLGLVATILERGCNKDS